MRFIQYNDRRRLFWRAMVLVTLASLSPSLTRAQSSGTEERITELTALVQKLQARVDDLEMRLAPAGGKTATSLAGAPVTASAAPSLATPAASPPALPEAKSLLGGTTVNVNFDGYYGYNFNQPIGRVNLLRAYDVSSNAFSINQAGLVLENAADPANGRRFGVRVDLQYGQATETLQGNAANEPRPDVWRNLFQAYGTYVVPVGKGLTVDFGKWASALGIEGNYTKDQLNYSRSFWFDFLPFYHMGVRANYKINDAIALNYWVTNGAQQTEPFNGFKDELVGLNLQPHKNVAWTVNYYFGQEHPDVQFYPNQTIAGLPTLQGTPFSIIPNAPQGKLHILDSYLTWQATPKLTFAIEGDYVIQRLYTNSSPQHTDGGAAYARYQFTPRIALAGRTEYLSDRGGLFTGATQSLKEATVTLEQKIADGFLLRQEWRRDFSNEPYFYTGTPGRLKKEQNTATVGVVWWFGGKQGSW